MSENEDTVPEVLEEKAPELNIGAALAEAREAMGLSVDEAAHQLRLSPRQLVALEANDYSGLPGATFVRGFVRNYARLLQLDAEPLLQTLSAQAQESAQHAITLQSEDIAISHRDKRPWIPYAIATTVVGVLLGSWLMYMDYRESHPDQQAEPVSAPQAEQQAGGYSPEADAATPVLPTEAAQVAALQPIPVATLAATALVSVSTASVAPAPVPANTKKAAPEAGSARLKIVYGKQSWVRINDRDGKEILHKNGPAGSEDVVDGKLPLKVEVGNVAGVQITFNDKLVDLAPHTKANVARFTLE